MTFSITIMPEFITQFGAVMAILTAVAVGGVALYGIVDKRKREVRNEENSSEDRLIVLFKEEIKQLTKRIDEQDDIITHLEEKVDKMTHENEILLRALQGKDEVTQKFQKDAYGSMEKLNALLDLAKSTNENITKLAAIMERRSSKDSDKI